MNVYSIVPSQRSQATVSVMNSKMIPRKAQIVAPTSSAVAAVFSSSAVIPGIARAMKTIVSVFAIVQNMNARSQRKYLFVRYMFRSTIPNRPTS